MGWNYTSPQTGLADLVIGISGYPDAPRKKTHGESQLILGQLLTVQLVPFPLTELRA
jgi:hypothetical protein